MRKTILLTGCLGIFAAVSRLAADSPPPGTLQQDAKKTMRDTGQYVHEKREDYEKRIRTDLDDLKAKIGEREKKLGKDATAVEKKTNRALRKKITVLRRQMKALESELRRVRTSGEAELEGLKTGINRDMDKLKKGYNDLFENMKLK